MRWLFFALTGLCAAIGMVGACAGDAVLVEDPPDGGAGGTGGTGGAGGMREPCPEVVSTVPTGDCDLFLQDCPPPEACMVMFDGVEYFRGCIPPTDGKGVMEACATSEECASPLRCTLGRCSPPCCSANDEPCGDTGLCLAYLTAGSYETNHCAFLEPCVLFSPQACAGAAPPGLCHVVAVAGGSFCAPPAPVQVGEGESCVATNQCGESQICTPPGNAAARCRYSCYLDSIGSGLPGEGGCPSGQTCTDLQLELPNVGTCLP